MWPFPYTGYLVLSICITIFCSSNLRGQTSDEFDFDRIEDNSFLIEEAYNQEPGVIQHISSFQYMSDKTWLYTFTDEWPAGGRKHQLSATIPVAGDDAAGLGDVVLNYRYQAVLRSRLAFSPRFSIIFPTGNYRKGFGEGVPGYQINLPVSYLISTAFVTHYNLGVTFTPGARSIDGIRSDLTVLNYGFSIIQFFRKNFNFMLETAGMTTFTKGNNTGPETSTLVLVNPGFRAAINFKSGLQIVPGFSVPVGLGSSSGKVGVLGYLSFEHPLWKPKRPD